MLKLRSHPTCSKFPLIKSLNTFAVFQALVKRLARTGDAPADACG